MKNTEVAKVSLQGPSIAGTVTVNLIELDRMRADHAAAVKYASELEEKQALVKVIITERQNIYDYNKYNGRYAKDDKYVELGVEYKGFDEFRDIISQEEHAKVVDKIKMFQKTIQDQSDSILKKNEENLALKSELDKLKNTELAQCIKTNEGYIKELNEVRPFVEKYKKQVDITDGINQRLALALKDAEYWKNKQSFWGWLWR